MPGSQHKNSNMNSQANTAPPETGNSTAIGLKKSSSLRAYKKIFKMIVMNTLKNLKDDMNKCLNGHRKDKELNEIMKIS